MKNMIKEYSKIKVNGLYYYDIKEQLSGLHKGTKTVKVLSISNRINAAPLAEVLSIETNERFFVDISHLQVNPNFLKRKYNTLRRYYKKNNPNMIIKFKSFVNQKYEQYIIIGLLPEVNNVLAIDITGVVHSFDYDWTKLNLERNISYDRQQEVDMEDYYDLDFFDNCSDF